MDSFKELEHKVGRVAREMAALRKQNRSLASQVKRLKREAKSSPGEDSGEWQRQRSEIRRRTRNLASTLESLLE